MRDRRRKNRDLVDLNQHKDDLIPRISIPTDPRRQGNRMSILSSTKLIGYSPY